MSHLYRFNMLRARISRALNLGGDRDSRAAFIGAVCTCVGARDTAAFPEIVAFFVKRYGMAWTMDLLIREIPRYMSELHLENMERMMQINLDKWKAVEGGDSPDEATPEPEPDSQHPFFRPITLN